ncbi:DNA damage-binding protein 1-like [Solanum stenotomum]|uniref:DNA damage-binding protein 1-like n=1 Tax=Solanum stenotomum TaxID=172797 RepID=UPI0020D1BFA2|nr:DNA damage-binding protein 1-like [Solanum stenotomum]
MWIVISRVCTYYSKFAAVGLWHDNSVNIYSLPGLNLVGKEILGGIESLPHSVLMCSFNRRCYLFCGLANGHLMHFELNMVTGQLKGGELLGKKKLSLGTQPVTLCAFLSNEATHIFAASNTSMVIYNSNKKIFCCEVNNLNDVTVLKLFQIALQLLKDKGDQLVICNIDERQKLHIIHSEHLGERVVTDFLFIILARSCKLNCSFSEDDHVYYWVGTAYLKLDANECTKFYKLYRVANSMLVAEMETDGTVYCLNAFTGKLLAAINQNIKLYKWTSLKNCRGRELKPGCLYRGSVLSRFIQTHGDAMRSISLLRLKVLVVTIYLKK